MTLKLTGKFALTLLAQLCLQVRVVYSIMYVGKLTTIQTVPTLVNERFYIALYRHDICHMILTPRLQAVPYFCVQH